MKVFPEVKSKNITLPSGIEQWNDIGSDCYVFNLDDKGIVCRGAYWDMRLLVRDEGDDVFFKNFDYVYCLRTRKTYKMH